MPSSSHSETPLPNTYGTRTDRPPYTAGISPSCTAIGGCMTATGTEGHCLYCNEPVTRVARQRLADEIARLQP